MIISSPDHIELRKAIVGPNVSCRDVRFLFDGVGEYQLARGEVLLVAYARVVGHNYSLGIRTFQVSFTPHNTITILTRFYDYLMDTIEDLADEVLDVHYTLERLI